MASLYFADLERRELSAFFVSVFRLYCRQTVSYLLLKRIMTAGPRTR